MNELACAQMPRSAPGWPADRGVKPLPLRRAARTPARGKARIGHFTLRFLRPREGHPRRGADQATSLAAVARLWAQPPKPPSGLQGGEGGPRFTQAGIGWWAVSNTVSIALRGAGRSRGSFRGIITGAQAQNSCMRLLPPPRAAAAALRGQAGINSTEAASTTTHTLCTRVGFASAQPKGRGGRACGGQLTRGGVGRVHCACTLCAHFRRT